MKNLLKDYGVVEKLCLDSDEELKIVSDQIHFHKYLVNEGIRHEIDIRDAAFSWYESVYIPVIEAIDSHGIWEEFKHLSRVQIYSNICTHWFYMKTESRQDVTPLSAALDFCAKFASNSLARFVYRVKKAVA